jgi:NitT/TauT family transport system permease protein
MPSTDTLVADRLDVELAGLDELLVWSGWKPEYLLPGPAEVLETLFDNLDTFVPAAATTLGRAIQGFALAVAIGSVIGALVARNRILRAGIGSMISGIQTMPSIAWFPLAILLFKLTEGAILFVVVLGAAPSVDQRDRQHPAALLACWPGARCPRSARLPARDPPRRAALVRRRAQARVGLCLAEPARGRAARAHPGATLARRAARAEPAVRRLDSAGLIATMIVIFVVGVIVDALCFGTAERFVRRRYGLVEEAAPA